MFLGLELDIISKNMIVEKLPGFYLPTRYFLTVGEGADLWKEVALYKSRMAAGLESVKIIRLSSIVGPRCRKRRWVVEPGSTVNAAFAEMTCDEAGRRIASAVAVAHPADRARAAVVMEYHGFATAKEAKEIVTQMARAAILNRQLQVRRVESIAIEHVVGTARAGATFAAVVEL